MSIFYTKRVQIRCGKSVLTDTYVRNVITAIAQTSKMWAHCNRFEKVSNALRISTSMLKTQASSARTIVSHLPLFIQSLRFWINCSECCINFIMQNVNIYMERSNYISIMSVSLNTRNQLIIYYGNIIFVGAARWIKFIIFYSLLLHIAVRVSVYVFIIDLVVETICEYICYWYIVRILW